MDEVEQAVPLQHFLPEVVCSIAVGIRGLPTPPVTPAPLEPWLNSRMSGHPCYVKVNGKVDQEAVAQANRELLGAAVVLVQIDSADVVLPS